MTCPICDSDGGHTWNCSLCQSDATDGATGGGEDTVAFVQEWLMNADYEPTKFDRDFAAAIDARVAATTTGADLLEQAARETLLSELRSVARAMDLVDFHAREPDLDLKPSACRAIVKDAIRALSARNLTDGGEK